MCSSYHEGHGKSKHYCRIIPIAAFFLLYLAIFPDSSYNTDKQMACRSSRPEYDERVCLTSASDGVPSSAEYRLHVRRNLPQRVVPFLNHISNFTSPHHFLILQGCVHQMKLVTIHCSLLEKYRKDPEITLPIPQTSIFSYPFSTKNNGKIMGISFLHLQIVLKTI